MCLRWISSTIRKLRDTEWNTWNHLNQTINKLEGLVKLALLENINNHNIFHPRRVMFRIPSCCQFLFNTNLHSLLLRPMCQRLSWIMSVSSAILCCQQQISQPVPKKDTNQSLIYYINESLLISSLKKKEHPPPAPHQHQPEQAQTSLHWTWRRYWQQPTPRPLSLNERYLEPLQDLTSYGRQHNLVKNSIRCHSSG